MFKNLQILNNGTSEALNSLIKISNAYIANSYKLKKDVIIPNKPKEFDINNVYLMECYSEFINLGKIIYNESKGIIPIKFEYKIISLNYLVNLRKKLSLKMKNKILLEWLNKNSNIKPVYLVKYCDKLEEKKVEIDMLCDIAVFSYVVNSALAHFYIYDTDKDKKKYYKDAINLLDNKITINTLIDSGMKKEKLISIFYDYLNYTINEYEKFRRYRLQASSLHLTIQDGKPEFVNGYNDIVFFYWEVLKLQIYSMAHNYQVVNVCRCGNVILGRKKMCESCNALNDNLRKQGDRDNIKSLCLNCGKKEERPEFRLNYANNKKAKKELIKPKYIFHKELNINEKIPTLQCNKCKEWKTIQQKKISHN